MDVPELILIVGVASVVGTDTEVGLLGLGRIEIIALESVLLLLLLFEVVAVVLHLVGEIREVRQSDIKLLLLELVLLRVEIFVWDLFERIVNWFISLIDGVDEVVLAVLGQFKIFKNIWEIHLIWCRWFVGCVLSELFFLLF